MTNLSNSGGQAESPRDEPVSAASSSAEGALSGDPQNDPQDDPQSDPRTDSRSDSPPVSDIDREVADALGSMDAGDLAELCGEVALPVAKATPIAESCSSGDKLTGRVVGVTQEEIFIEFGPKAQGILPVSQFNEDDHPKVGQTVEVVVERFDEESSLLLVNREGAVIKASWENLNVGMIVQGRVTGLNKGGLELSVNGIRAFMPASQASTAPMKDLSVLLNEVMQCQVIELDRRGKNVLVSRRKLIEQQQREQREALLAELAVGQVRHGVVVNITDFGAFVDLGGLEGLVHIRDLSWGSVDKVSDVLSTGMEVDVQVLKIELKRNRISLGLKQALPDPWTGIADRFPAGTAAKARIVRLVDFGAFAELEPGVDALIPISEMGWSRTQQSGDAVQVDDIVDTVVIRNEPEKRRIALSMKQAQSDPWEGVLESFAEQSLVKGRVTRLADFGAFVEVAAGVEGLIHISELSNDRVRSTGDVVTVGQEVEARVLGVDKDNRRISLSIKAVHEPEVGAASEALPETPRKPKKRKKPLRGGLGGYLDW